MTNLGMKERRLMLPTVVATLVLAHRSIAR
jgi:hypothetical protein